MHLQDEASQSSGSRRIEEASGYAGVWNVTGGKKLCRISILPERVESANAWAVAGAACLNDTVGVVAGWRPEPDGIAFAGADGLTIAMFADQGDGRWTWRGLTLRRATSE